MEETWACAICYNGGVEYGELGPGISLIKFKDLYSVLAGQGHGGDRWISFKIEPTPDPCTDDEDDEQAGKSFEWMLLIDDNIVVHKLVFDDIPYYAQLCQKMGYRPNHDGRLSYWLFDKCGKLIAENKTVELKYTPPVQENMQG